MIQEQLEESLPWKIGCGHLGCTNLVYQKVLESTTISSQPMTKVLWSVLFPHFIGFHIVLSEFLTGIYSLCWNFHWCTLRVPNGRHSRPKMGNRSVMCHFLSWRRSATRYCMGHLCRRASYRRNWRGTYGQFGRACANFLTIIFSFFFFFLGSRVLSSPHVSIRGKNTTRYPYLPNPSDH